MFGLLRKGWGRGGNTLVTLFVFFGIGLLLHFKGNTQPLVKLWQQLRDTIYTTGEETPSGTSGDLPAEASDPGLSDPQNLRQALRRRDFHLPLSVSNLQIVHHQGFSLGYAERYEQAAWVAYPLVRAQVQGQGSRERLFLPDPKVKTGSAVFADYTRSGYDRGHLAPAADFKNVPEHMKETFFMSNISPQDRDFNAGIWNDLEKRIRSWADRYEKIYVVTGPVLRPGLQTIGRINKVAVPQQFYKIILHADPPQVKGIAFLLDNKPAAGPLSKFVVSIDTVEELTGLDFFSALPDDLENKIEVRSTPEDWYRLR